MGYYPIKCVHCMRSVAMDERCVKMVPEEVKTFNSRLDGSQPIVVLNNNKKNKQIEYKSLRELRNSHVIEHEEIHPIKISGEYQNIEECRKDFVQSIDVKDLEIDGTKMSGTIRKFYCPYCHNEIISMAGKLPMYLISIMGPSSAGKTVYLTVLHKLLGGINYPLPQGHLSFDNFGEMSNEFRKFALALNRTGTLPSTTTENRKDPYLLRVNYIADDNSQEVNKQCLIGLIDMRGEMLHGDHDDDLMDFNLPQFKEANGFIMMVDPETLEGVYNHLPEQYFGGRSIEQLDETLGSMRQTIINCITAEMGCIEKPSVVALAKQDILCRNYQQLGIPLNQTVIAPNFRPVKGTNLKASYYEPMSKSTRACISHLSGSFTSFLETTFKEPYFVSLSALGSFVNISGNKLDNVAKIRPVRVEEPILKLLMDFNFLPKFCSDEYYADPQGVMNEWGKTFAENWAEKEAMDQPKKHLPKKNFWNKGKK